MNKIIYPSKQKALDGTQITEDLVWDPIDYSKSSFWIPDWRRPIDISKEGLDAWQKEAQERVMKHIDFLIAANSYLEMFSVRTFYDLHYWPNKRGYVPVIK